jgi:catecholate siderophore receptor
MSNFVLPRAFGHGLSCALAALVAGTAAHADGGASVAAGTAPSPGDAEAIVVTGVQEQGGYVPSDSGAAKIAAPLKDIPQSIAVVPLAVLQDQRALSLQDALKNVPGVSFSSGDGQRDQVSIRGFTAIADQFVDGYRDDGLYFRDLSNVERVEVIKGPAAVLYGRGSSGGLINRVTKKPTINLTSATFSAGSYDSYRGEWDVSRFDKKTGVGFRLTGAYENDGSFRDQQFLKRFAIAPSLLLGQGSDTTLLVQADYLKDSRLNDFGIPAINGRPVDVPRSTYYGAANARDADVARSEVLSQTVSLSHRFSDSLSFRNGFRHYRYTLNRHNTNATALNQATGALTISHGGILRDEDGWSNQSELTQKLDLAGTHHTILYGFEIARQVKEGLTIQSRTVAVTNIFNPVVPAVNNANYTALSANQLSTFDTRGLYAQDLIDFGHGIKAMLGLRHDWFIQKTEQRLPGQPNLARTDKKFSPRAGLIFQPDDQQSYYASWSRSFQPSAETFALAANNAGIAPEQTANKEIGAKYTLLGGHLSVQVAGFILKRTGIKGTDPTTNQLIPIGTQRTRGAELSAALDLPSGIRAIAGYAYMDTRVIRSATPSFVDKRATITPKNSANIFVTKTILEHYGIGAGGNYVGNRWADPANTTVLPHYVTADAMGWAEFGPVRLQINVYNLTDKHYIISGHGTSPLLNMPGAPRTVMGTVRFAL